MVQDINLTLFLLFFLKLAALDKLLDLHIQVCYRLSLLFSEVIQVLVSVLSMSARFLYTLLKGWPNLLHLLHLIHLSLQGLLLFYPSLPAISQMCLPSWPFFTSTTIK